MAGTEGAGVEIELSGGVVLGLAWAGNAVSEALGVMENETGSDG